MSDTIKGDFAHDGDGKPVYFAPTPDPTTPPAWTWWKGVYAMWYINDRGLLMYSKGSGHEPEVSMTTPAGLDEAYPPRRSPETCPARPRPTTDAASRAIAAHTTPGVVDPLIGGILSAFFPFARESVQVAESIRKAETLGEAEYVLNRYAAKVRERAINDCTAAVMRQMEGQ